LVDFGRILVRVAGIWLAFLVLALGFEVASAGYNATGGPSLPGLPDWFGHGMIIFIMVLIFSTNRRSYHEIKFYFPRLSWLGVFLLTAYAWGVWELSLLFSPHPPGSFGEPTLRLFIGLLVMSPMSIFLAIIYVGYSKLMDKREGRTPSGDIADYF
jgi:hypothetical protein